MQQQQSSEPAPASHDLPDRAGSGEVAPADLGAAADSSGRELEQADDRSEALTASAHDDAGGAEAGVGALEDPELTGETSSFCYDRPASEMTRMEESTSTAGYRE